MTTLQIAIGLFLIWIVVVYAFWIRWMRMTVKQIGDRLKGGLEAHPLVAKQIRSVYLVHSIFTLVQVVLCLMAVLFKPSNIGWAIIIPLLFALNFSSRARADKLMQALIGQGQ